MVLIIDVKVNNKKIYTLTATRYERTEAKGLNPYHVELFDDNLNSLYKGMTCHLYEEGAIKLIQRMAQDICQNYPKILK